MKQRAVAVYVGALGIAAIACGAVLARWYPATGSTTWAALPVLVALLVAAEYFFVRYHVRGHVYALNLVEAVLAPLVVGFPGLAVVVAVFLAQALAAGLRRNKPIKAAFNIAQWTLAAGVGALTFAALGDGRQLTVQNLAALTAALAAATLVNDVAFTAVMALANGRGLRWAVRELAPIMAAAWLVSEPLNIAVGLLLAAAYSGRPITVVLFAVPLGILRWASVAYAEARADRSRMAGLQRATHALTQPVDPLEGIPAFLAEVRATFEVEVVELVLLDGDMCAVHRLSGADAASYHVDVPPTDGATLASVVAGEGRPVRVGPASPDLLLGGRLRAEGWRDFLGVPLSDGTERLGALCTYNRVGLEGFEEGELAVLRALASEMASTIKRSRLVKAILDERAKLDQIVTRTSDGITTIAADGTVTSWNPGLEQISGYTASEMVGAARLGMLRPHGPDGSDVLLERWAEVPDLPEKLQILTRSGQTRYLACSYSRTTGADGFPDVLVVVAREVTEAQRLAQLKDDLIATVSHEFRTPLVPIKGWAELLTSEMPFDDSQRQSGARTILRHAVRLEQLVENFLEVAKVESDFQQATMADLEVADLAGRVAEEFRVVHPDRVVAVEAPRAAWAVGHELWVEQILSNLVANAVKYSPPGSPVDIAVSQSPDAVAVAVTDRGEGIAAADIERIFDRFERLNSQVQNGTGLGLYIARQLATALGGTITVESELGNGSTFTLTLRSARKLRVVS